MSEQDPVRVVFVCMGNICRSPTAEGIFRQKLIDTGLSGRVETDSAGTHAYHVGQPPDRRAQEEARRRGLDISDLRGRQVAQTDFDEFDWIIAMDSDNVAILLSEAPPARRDRIHRLLDFAPHLGERDVPDPYFGGVDGFRRVFDLVEQGCEGLIEKIRQT